MNQFDICSSSPQVFMQLAVNHDANCNAKYRLVLCVLRPGAEVLRTWFLLRPVVTASLSFSPSSGYLLRRRDGRGAID
jgi:hypothetical protein